MRIGLIVLLFSLSLSSWAMRVFIDHQTYYSPETGSYIEFAFSFDAKSMIARKDELGKYFCKAKCTVALIDSKSDSIVKVLSINAQSEKSITNLVENFMVVERMTVPDGQYILEFNLSDLNNLEDKGLLHQEEINISHLSQGSFISDLAFISAFTPTIETNAFSKGGYDFIPYVSNYYPSTINSMIIYGECYNSNLVIGKKTSFAFAIEITDNLDKPIPDYKRIIRAESNDIVPFIHSFDIKNLPSGEYKLKVEMLDRSGNVVCTKKRNFTRNKISDEKNGFEPPLALDVANTFVGRYINSDSLYQHILSLSPIAESVERSTISNVLQNADLQTRQSFMYTFWIRRAPENPDLAWKNYYTDVLAVQQEFGTKIKAGWQTDRGRVYLQYGKPSTRIVKNNDPDYWPFEIWHYYTTNNGMRDRRFLFYNTSLTSDKELLHSDILSEVQNYDWKNLVRSRRMNDPTSVGRNSSNQNSDPYSRDELEDLWYNPH
jgi:GWxTD domain-containing protein